MLLAWDVLCLALPRRWQRGASPAVRKLPISNWAHLGDVLIAGSLIRPLQTHLPEVEIGFLSGSWNRAAIESLSGVRWLHVVDHWRLSRRPEGLRCKVCRYLADRARALAEIRSVGYDAAIETYQFFPNTCSLLWQAGIPIRVGYTSGGGPLLTHRLRWIPADRHIAAYHQELLRVLVPASSLSAPRMPEIGTSCMGEQLVKPPSRAYGRRKPAQTVA